MQLTRVGRENLRFVLHEVGYLILQIMNVDSLDLTMVSCSYI